MKVRVTQTRRPQYWYAKHIGKVFEVASEDALDYHVTDTDGTGSSGAIWKTDAEVVVEDDRFVFHDGTKYKVPGWAKYLTRDQAEGAYVFAWEKKPVWTPLPNGYRRATGDGTSRFTDVKPYVEPMPEGNFIKEI